MSAGYESSPCDVCGEQTIVRRGTTPSCRMTPACTGHHRPPIPEQLRRTDHTPLHRVDDGRTARAAAREQTPATLSRTRLQVLEALRVLGASTDHDIADHAELLLSSSTKRRGDLVRMGLVAEHGTGVSPSGCAASTWSITPAGLAALDQMKRGSRAT